MSANVNLNVTFLRQARTSPSTLRIRVVSFSAITSRTFLRDFTFYSASGQDVRPQRAWTVGSHGLHLGTRTRERHGHDTIVTCSSRTPHRTGREPYPTLFLCIVWSCALRGFKKKRSPLSQTDKMQGLLFFLHDILRTTGK